MYLTNKINDYKKMHVLDSRPLWKSFLEENKPYIIMLGVILAMIIFLTVCWGLGGTESSVYYNKEMI